MNLNTCQGNNSFPWNENKPWNRAFYRSRGGRGTKNSGKSKPYLKPGYLTRVGIKYPEIGAFEVHFRGMKVFSKIRLYKWPNVQKIIKILRKVMNHFEVRGTFLP